MPPASPTPGIASVKPSTHDRATTLAALGAARTAARDWRNAGLASRLRVLENLRHRIADSGLDLAAAARTPFRTSDAETLVSEVIPLAETCRFLVEEAPAILGDSSLRGRRPWWLRRVRSTEIHEPLGTVLVIGASNYPLFLPGAQILHALAAGNAVLIKPGQGGTRAADALCALITESGAPKDVVHVLTESPETASLVIAEGVDKVFLTGSVKSGHAVLAAAAASLTPVVVELSGCDAVFVRKDADLDLVARAVVFGLTLNSSATCIAPRRVFVPVEMQDALADRIARRLLPSDRDASGGDLNAPGSTASCHVDPRSIPRLRDGVVEAIRNGARIIRGELPDGLSDTRIAAAAPWILADVPADSLLATDDLFAPVTSLIPVRDDSQALEFAEASPYALGASVFGRAVDDAERFARRVDAGVVVINDLIVPTADPRVSFGGRGASGFGLTRGAHGLLEMTRLKTVLTQRGRFLPHLDGASEAQTGLFNQALRLLHGASIGSRLRALRALVFNMSKTGRDRTRASGVKRSKSGA